VCSRSASQLPVARPSHAVRSSAVGRSPRPTAPQASDTRAVHSGQLPLLRVLRFIFGLGPPSLCSEHDQCFPSLGLGRSPLEWRRSSNGGRRRTTVVSNWGRHRAPSGERNRLMKAADHGNEMGFGLFLRVPPATSHLPARATARHQRRDRGWSCHFEGRRAQAGQSRTRRVHTAEAGCLSASERRAREDADRRDPSTTETISYRSPGCVLSALSSWRGPSRRGRCRRLFRRTRRGAGRMNEGERSRSSPSHRMLCGDPEADGPAAMVRCGRADALSLARSTMTGSMDRAFNAGPVQATSEVPPAHRPAATNACRSVDLTTEAGSQRSSLRLSGSRFPVSIQAVGENHAIAVP
jgi:hypothetical protein